METDLALLIQELESNLNFYKSDSGASSVVFKIGQELLTALKNEDLSNALNEVWVISHYMDETYEYSSTKNLKPLCHAIDKIKHFVKSKLEADLDFLIEELESNLTLYQSDPKSSEIIFKTGERVLSALKNKDFPLAQNEIRSIYRSKKELYKYSRTQKYLKLLFIAIGKVGGFLKSKGFN